MKKYVILGVLVISLLTLVAAQSCKVYDDFSSPTLNISKWEIRQDVAEYPLTNEYWVDGNLKNFHIQQSIIERQAPNQKHTYIFPKRKFTTGDVLEYDINLISKEGSYMQMVLLTGDQYIRVGIFGWWSNSIQGYNELGTSHIKIEFQENNFHLERTTPSNITLIDNLALTNSNGEYELYVGGGIGDNGKVHMDFDNFELCREWNLPYFQEEKLDFTGNQNIIRYLSLPKNSFVNSAYLDLTGYRNSKLMHVSDNSDREERDVIKDSYNIYTLGYSTVYKTNLEFDESAYTQLFTLGIDCGYSNVCTFTGQSIKGKMNKFFILSPKDKKVYVVDINGKIIKNYSLDWFDGLVPGTSLYYGWIETTPNTNKFWVFNSKGQVWETNSNFKLLATYNLAHQVTWTDIDKKYFYVGDFANYTGITRKYNYKFNLIEEMDLRTYNGGTGFTSDFDYKNPKTFYSVSTDVNNNAIFLSGVIENPYLKIGTPGKNYEWKYSKEFNQKTARTKNLAGAINSALNKGACNCEGCQIIDNNCSIPFTFHSDSMGILEISGISLTYN